jgi:REP element-mobilizing transposase RayT
MIAPAWRPQLYEYLGGTVKGLGARSEIVEGTSDHVHLLVELKATHTLSDFMRELKKASSIWVREKAPLTIFAWQEGYAAFTVSASALPDVRHYIETQEEHHQQRTFREELKILLKKSGVSFEERYLD